MWQNILLLLPVVLPVIAGLAAWKTEKREARNILVGAALILNALLVLLAVTRGSEEFMIWQLTENVPVYFHVDGISKLFSLLISCMWALVGVYSFEYMAHEENENRFYLFYMISLGVLIGLSFSGNLVTMYMFYELMTLMTLPLVLHEMTKEAIAAGIKYLLYSVFGASLALLGRLTGIVLALPVCIAAAFALAAACCFRAGMRHYLQYSCNRYKGMGHRS